MNCSWIRWGIATLAIVGAVSCSNQKADNQQDMRGSASLIPMTPAEATADFREMVRTFRMLYGPLEYKEQRFGFSFDQWAAEIEGKLQNVKSDAETFGLYSQFIARFQDGHLGIRFPINSTQTMNYSVPIYLMPIENTFVVAQVDPGFKDVNIAKGDEVISIDGQTPQQILDVISKYKSFATPESNKHLIIHAFSRPFYMSELVPTKNTVKVVYKKADGRTLTEDFVWKISPLFNDKMVEDQRPGLFVPFASEQKAVAGNSLLSMSQPKPFFATEEVVKTYGFNVVTANEEYRAKYGLKETDKPDIFAALYRVNGKTILLVRNFVYYHNDFSNEVYLKGYKAIMNQWESMADVLVLDQTHNGGGSYCEEFFRLFIQSEKDGFVQNLNVDRKWVTDLRTSWADSISESNGVSNMKRAYEAMGSTVENALDRGLSMTEPLPIIGGANKVTPADYNWKKPMLVLVDELAGSCGDAFPMLIKNNKVAKIFGQRTMGLGGNVEGFTLSNSQASFRMTRGLFTSHRDDGKYSPELYIENNGVQPDYLYDHSMDDFRKGFVGYVKAFSEKALEQIPAN